MAPSSGPEKEERGMRALIELTNTTQTLVTHFQSSLAPASASTARSLSELPNPLEVIKATVTLLKSHTTTLSLLLLTPPLTPSAVTTKIGDVSTSVLSSMVAAASSTPGPGQKDELGTLMRTELRAQVRRLLGTWSEILTLVSRFAERRVNLVEKSNAKGKDERISESERQEVLASTGVVWEACDALLKTCQDGVVGLVVKKAEEWRGVLLDAIDELKEWGEDVDEEEDDTAQESGEDADGFGDEDDIFGAANKLGKNDKKLKALLDTSVKKLKMVGMLYQALIKRRLKAFPKTVQTASAANGNITEEARDSTATLDELMDILKSIPETVDDLASAFYDLDENESRKTLETCCGEAKGAVALVKQNWAGKEDEFTVWSTKWIGALDAVK